jgi:hypothetical protein
MVRCRLPACGCRFWFSCCTTEFSRALVAGSNADSTWSSSTCSVPAGTSASDGISGFFAGPGVSSITRSPSRPRHCTWAWVPVCSGECALSTDTVTRAWSSSVSSLVTWPTGTPPISTREPDSRFAAFGITSCS